MLYCYEDNIFIYWQGFRFVVLSLSAGVTHSMILVVVTSYNFHANGVIHRGQVGRVSDL